MPQQTAFAAKGEVVEEWVDLKFFRPAGYRLAKVLLPTKVSPDLLTGICLALGLVAGRLFFYRSFVANASGLVLFIISDIFDSADGQLARMRGTSTRLGRVLDGLSDNARFVNLYLNLIGRLWRAGGGWPAVVLGVIAGVSHSFQSSVADFIRQAYQFLTGAGGELDLPEDVESSSASNGGAAPAGVVAAFYLAYVRRQARLFPATVAVARAQRSHDTPTLANDWALAQRSNVVWCALIAQNIRFALLAVTALWGWASGFFWLTAVPLNLVMVVLTARHERYARGLGAIMEPSPKVRAYA